jgi:hypothetical protein
MLGFDTMPEIRTNEYHEFVKSLSKNCPVICLAVLAHGILDQPWVAQTLLMGTVGLQAFSIQLDMDRLLYSIISLPGVMMMDPL